MEDLSQILDHALKRISSAVAHLGKWSWTISSSPGGSKHVCGFNQEEMKKKKMLSFAPFHICDHKVWLGVKMWKRGLHKNGLMLWCVSHRVTLRTFHLGLCTLNWPSVCCVVNIFRPRGWKQFGLFLPPDFLWETNVSHTKSCFQAAHPITDHRLSTPFKRSYCGVELLIIVWIDPEYIYTHSRFGNANFGGITFIHSWMWHMKYII